MRASLAITFGAAAIAMMSAATIAQQSHHGTVVQVEEAKGTITVSEAMTTGSTSQPNTAQEYKVQDGLLFNALNVGDVVTFTAEEKDGVKTITKLQAK